MSGRPTVNFYSKPDCPLCDVGLYLVRKLARRLEFDIQKIDISQDKQLYAKYGELIPVVEIKGEVIGYGKLSERELSSALRAKTRGRGLLQRFGLRR
jgi:hypothetical protein